MIKNSKCHVLKFGINIDHIKLWAQGPQFYDRSGTIDFDRLEMLFLQYANLNFRSRDLPGLLRTAKL